MKKKKFLLFSIVVAVLLALVAGGTVLGQEPEEPDVDSVTPVAPLPEPEEDIGPAEGEEGVGAAGEIGALAYPAKTMNYQGYLADGSGNPVPDDNYEMIFSLWDAETGGTREWGDETHAAVPVSNGLFSVALGETVPLDPYTDFDEQLYLEITVGGTTLPRQMLRAVPYAMGLTAGAHVRGGTDSASQYGLYVSNTGGPGIYTDGAGDDVYGIYNWDVTYSDEGYAGPATYVWIPATNVVIQEVDINDAHVEIQDYGQADIVADGDLRNVLVSIPIQVERPYGRDYLVGGATVYYQWTTSAGANTRINSTRLKGRDFSTGAEYTYGSDLTDYDSATYDDYWLAADADQYITAFQALTDLELTLRFDAAGDTVALYGVRLQLDSTY
jgi:hypothetical protein